MKKLICAIALSMAVWVAQAAPPAKSAREQLLKLEDEWNAAYNRHDKESVGRILRDDYTLIDADAYILSKQQYLDTMSRVQIKNENLKYPDVRVYGDTALVFSIWNGTYSFEGTDTTDRIRYVDVFIRENGQWRAVSSQGTRIPAAR